jgi:hypothetical protein
MGDRRSPFQKNLIMNVHVSDYDGDLLNYRWLEEGTVLSSGSIQTVKRGNPVNLATTLSNLTLGVHIITLQVSDGMNPAVSADMTVAMTDTTPPRLSPVANKTLYTTVPF